MINLHKMFGLRKASSESLAWAEDEALKSLSQLISERHDMAEEVLFTDAGQDPSPEFGIPPEEWNQEEIQEVRDRVNVHDTKIHDHIIDLKERGINPDKIQSTLTGGFNDPVMTSTDSGNFITELIPPRTDYGKLATTPSTNGKHPPEDTALQNLVKLLASEERGNTQEVEPEDIGDYTDRMHPRLQAKIEGNPTGNVQLSKESQSGGHYGGSDLAVDQSTHPKELKKKKYIEMIKQAFGVTTHRGASQAQKVGNKAQSRYQQRFPGMVGGKTQTDRRAQNRAMRTMQRNPNTMTRQGIQNKKLGRTGTNIHGGNVTQ